MKEAAEDLKGNKPAVVAGIVVLVYILGAVFAPFITIGTR